LGSINYEFHTPSPSKANFACEVVLLAHWSAAHHIEIIRKRLYFFIASIEVSVVRVD